MWATMRRRGPRSGIYANDPGGGKRQIFGLLTVNIAREDCEYVFGIGMNGGSMRVKGKGEEDQYPAPFGAAWCRALESEGES